MPPPAPFDLESWLSAHPVLPGALLAGLCLVGLAFALAPRFASWRRGRGRPVLSPLEAEEILLGTGLLVVDLRSGAAYQAGHIRGALHVPFPSLEARFQRPDPLVRRAMLLVDDTDALAHQAYGLLEARGYRWIYVLKGGMRAWRRAQRPTTRST